jgi:aminoglycoside phosphotransferase (APT) family kinase protein
MLRQIEEWLARAGFPADAEISTMTPGLGKTAMWRVSGTGRASDFVLRLFPPGDERWRDRETLAMRAVGAAGLPVPEVVRTGAVGDRPAMLMTLAPGTTVGKALGPGRATAIGRSLGELLGTLNQLPAPDGLAPADAWLDRAGPALAPLRDRLAALPNADRLLHLDYHPENVLIEGDAVTAIIDWTNTLPGPAHIDLGRSRAILQMIRTLRVVPPEVVAAVGAFESGLVIGHAAVHGPDPAPDLSLAWGFGTICVDFAPQVDRPESWVTRALVDELDATRDALIARALAS